MSSAGQPDLMSMMLLSSGNPDDYQNYLAIQRRQAMAQQLMEQGSQEVGPRAVGNFVVNNPWEGAASAAKQMLGAYMFKKSSSDMAQLYAKALRGGGSQQSFQTNPDAPASSFQGIDRTSIPVGSSAGVTPAMAGIASPSPDQSAPSGPQPSMVPSPSPQPQQQPQGGAGVFDIPGMDSRQSLILRMTAPDEWAKAFASAHQLTDTQRELNAANIPGPQQATILTNIAVAKGMMDVRQGNTVVSPTQGPAFSAPTSAGAGTQTVWTPTGPQVQMMPGAAGAISAATSAEAFPKAQANIYEAQNTPKIITPGSGEMFATAGGAASQPSVRPGSTPSPSVNLIDPSQPNYTGVPTSRLATSPQGLTMMKDQLPKQMEDVQDRAEAAQDTHYALMSMKSDLAQLGGSKQPWFTTGSNAGQRLALAKWVNSTLAAAGMKPQFDPQQVAAGEATIKTGTRLGFALSRTLGAREAAQIVQQAISANPGIQNTPAGNQLLIRSLDAVAQRDADRNQFFQQWMGKSGNTMGADVAFNQNHPVQSYVGLALAPDEARYQLHAHPETAHQFDQIFGQGAAERALHGAW